jgi:hypothetical protein
LDDWLTNPRWNIADPLFAERMIERLGGKSAVAAWPMETTDSFSCFQALIATKAPE